MVGPPYQTAVRLSAVAAGNWALIDGEYSGQGFDIFSLPFHRFLSVIYSWYVQRLSQEDRMKFEMELTKPLRGTPDRMSAEDEMDQLNYL
jgi:hypothetical protein